MVLPKAQASLVPLAKLRFGLWIYQRSRPKQQVKKSFCQTPKADSLLCDKTFSSSKDRTFLNLNFFFKALVSGQTEKVMSKQLLFNKKI